MLRSIDKNEFGTKVKKLPYFLHNYKIIENFMAY